MMLGSFLDGSLVGSGLALVAEEGTQGYVSILLRAIFVENILLAFFLGMCSYLAVSKRVDSSVGLGVAVIFVLGLTVPLNWIVQTYVLNPGALSWAGMPDSDLSYLQFLTFIATIAAAVQVV
jgi:Na+-transporting NADH:ubiquinone oxidoreductase subunit E